MIIQDHGDHLIVIRQTDHALLSGFFAREWGNDAFSKPEPLASFRMAAAEHDNGWQEWERFPQIDPATFSPYTFMSIPTMQHIEIYRHGIERIVQEDRYAGLLAAMHASGLYDRAKATIPGYSAKYVKSNEAQLVADFIARLRLQQIRLKVDLRADPATKDSADDKALHTNLQRLEALDRLSLYFCLAPQENALIDAVPTDEQAGEVDWEVRPQPDQSVVLRPYPFRRDPLDISILARRIPKRRYSDDADLQQTLALAEYFALQFTLSAGTTDVRTRAAACDISLECM
jgi:uncharacterized protein DUF3891